MKKIFKKVAIIPCYNVRNNVINVVKNSLKIFDLIICIDDKCPQNSGNLILNEFKFNKKIKVFFNKKNLGVGGAVKVGYNFCNKISSKYIVKIDGDGQMDPMEAKKFFLLIKNENCDYVKGNRFLDKNYYKNSPKIRFFGNLILNYITKISSGNYSISDPLNGYTCIKADFLKKINLNNISNDFFFETSMLIVLSRMKAKILDLKVNIKYAGEISNFFLHKELLKFVYYHLYYFFKKLFIK